MKNDLSTRRWMWSLLVMLVLIGACTVTKDNTEDTPRPPRRTSLAVAPTVDLGLQASVDAVQTIQLYSGKEDQLPVAFLNGSRTITLEFDLMEGLGRPFSVYFYHADRNWERDLFAAEYLSSFHRDDLFDYSISRSASVNYTHYSYTFPNQSIGFRISGNYILRVTEQGQEDEVLFERPFFVAENATSTQMGIENVMIPGQGYPSAQPLITFTPPSALAGNVFDYNVCFVQNGRFEHTRCSDNPSLTQQPDLLFFLQPEFAFEPQEGDFFLDLSNLRLGGSIERADLSTSPFQITLEPDYARFPSSGFDPLLNGQAVVSEAIRNVNDPDTEGEYAEVFFSYVTPDEERLPGGVYIVGSFNDWAFDLAHELTWVADRGQYEGVFLIKQGRYEYRYTSPDPQVRRMLQTRLPRSENLYSGFVYFSDTSLRTDRLLAFQNIRSR